MDPAFERIAEAFAAASTTHGLTWQRYEQLLAQYGHLLANDDGFDVSSDANVVRVAVDAESDKENVGGSASPAPSCTDAPLGTPVPAVIPEECVTGRTKTRKVRQSQDAASPQRAVAESPFFSPGVQPVFQAASPAAAAVAPAAVPVPVARRPAVVDSDDDDDDNTISLADLMLKTHITPPVAATVPTAADVTSPASCSHSGAGGGGGKKLRKLRKAQRESIASAVSVDSGDGSAEEGSEEESCAGSSEGEGDSLDHSDASDDDEEAEHSGDNEYDYTDGFLVADGEDEEEEDDEDDDASGTDAATDSDGEAEEEEEEDAGSSDESEVVLVRVKKGQVGNSTPPPASPVASARTATKTAPSGKTAQTPSMAGGKGVTSSAIKGSAVKAGKTPATASKACVTCSSRSCSCKARAEAAAAAAAALKDGDVDPSTGLIVIREELDKKLTGRKGGAEHASAASAATPGGGARPYMFRSKPQRETMTRALYAEYNTRVFNSALPADMTLEWGPRLTKTAGLTYTSMARGADGGLPRHTARIVLSTKVLDTPYKLAQTLLHEMCHAAAWLVDHINRPPHGAAFHKWATRASHFYPSRAVSVCHSYDIHHKYKYQCQNVSCGHIYGRHSKSVDVTRALCGMCRSGRLQLLGSFRIDGTPAKSGQSRAQSEYQLFVQRERPTVQRECPQLKPTQILSELAKRWTAYKAQRAAAMTPSAVSAAAALLNAVDEEDVEVVSVSVSARGGAGAAAVEVHDSDDEGSIGSGAANMSVRIDDEDGGWAEGVCDVTVASTGEALLLDGLGSDDEEEEEEAADENAGAASGAGKGAGALRSLTAALQAVTL